MPSYIPPALPGHVWLRTRSVPWVFHYFHVAEGVSLCTRQLLTAEFNDDGGDPYPPIPLFQCRDCRKLHLEILGGHPDSLRRYYQPLDRARRRQLRRLQLDALLARHFHDRRTA